MYNRPPRPVTINYRLPTLVESVQQGWIQSCQSGLFVSATLTILSVILWLFLEARSRTSSQWLETLGCASFFLNISGCTSAFILIDCRLKNLAWNASKTDKSPPGGKVTSTQPGIFKIYGAGVLWTLVVLYWRLCFILGICSVYGQVLLYIWMEESPKVKIVGTTLVGFGIFPPLVLILAPALDRITRLPNFESNEESIKSPVHSNIEPGASNHGAMRQPTYSNPPQTPIRLQWPLQMVSAQLEPEKSEV